MKPGVKDRSDAVAAALSVAGVAHRATITVGQVRLEVLIDGQGPTVVLLPSSQRDSVHETDFVQALAAEGFTVLRPQPRGMAGSVGPLDGGVTLVDLADDVAAVIDALGHGRAVVAGHAFGHSIARVTAWRHPARLRGVAQLGAATSDVPRHLLDSLDQIADGVQPPSERLDALRTIMFAPGNDPSPWLDGWYPHLRPAYRRAARHPPRADWWARSPVPVLDLQGNADPWRPPATRNELRDGLGAAVTVAVVDGASHALLPERPKAVAEAIARWMHGLPAA